MFGRWHDRLTNVFIVLVVALFLGVMLKNALS
jgi:hypothetical protein